MNAVSGSQPVGAEAAPGLTTMRVWAAGSAWAPNMARAEGWCSSHQAAAFQSYLVVRRTRAPLAE